MVCTRASALIRPSTACDIGLDGFAARQPHDRLRQRQRVLGAVIDFARQQGLALFGALAFGDVDGDAADADHAAALVDGRRRRPDAPANFAVRPADPEFRLVGSLHPCRIRRSTLAQLVDVVRMQQRLDIWPASPRSVSGSTPKIRYWPSSHIQSPLTQSQSHEPILPAAIARLRRCSLSSSRRCDSSSSAVRARTRSSSSALNRSSCRVLR